MEQKTNKQLKDLYKNFAPIFKEEKTQKFSTLALTLLTLSFFGIFAINPTVSTIVNLQKQLSDSQFVDKKLQEKINSLAALQVQFESIKGSIPDILKAVPEKPHVPLFAAQLQGVAQKNNVAIGRLQIFQVELSKTPTASKDYSSFGFTLDVEGQQDSLTKFLSSLIGFDRVVSIESISLTKDKTKNTLQLSLRGKTYFKP